jgi:hypothetical protein
LVNESLDQVGDSLLSGRGGVELHLARWNGCAPPGPAPDLQAETRSSGRRLPCRELTEIFFAAVQLVELSG